MIKELNCGSYSVKVFQDNRLSDLSILIPTDYDIYTRDKSNNDYRWYSHDELSYEILSNIKTDCIKLVNRNANPIYGYLMRSCDKKQNQDYLKFAAANCQHILIWKDENNKLTNAEYCTVLNIFSYDGQRMVDYIDLIDYDAYEGFNMGYEKEIDD